MGGSLARPPTTFRMFTLLNPAILSGLTAPHFLILSLPQVGHLVKALATESRPYLLTQTPNALLVQELGGRGLSRFRSIPELWFPRSPTLPGMWPHLPHNPAAQALRR